VLGCTSPVLEFSDFKNTIIFLADGKFHMEGAMIANPRHTYFKYHPYEQEFIKEEYDFDRMIVNRK
jgi:2-(3-amino-3-carboxypropyl)histidine synthase